MQNFNTEVVKRVDLNTQAYNIILGWLMGHHLKPGQQLTLANVAERLGISRTPVHHALTRLVSENLLEVKPNQGFYVIPITSKTIREAFDVRMALELLAAERSVGYVSPEQLAELRLLMEGTNSAIEGDKFIDKNKYLDLNRKFHKYQVSLANNEFLNLYYQNIKVNLLMRRILYKREVGVGIVVRLHEEIVEAFEAEDLPRVQQAIRVHTEAGVRVSLEEISENGGAI